LRSLFRARKPSIDLQKVEMLEGFEEAGFGYFWATDSAGDMTYLSDTALDALGWNAAQVIGQPIGKCFLQPKAQDTAFDRPITFLLSARNKVSRLNVRLESARGEAWWEISGKPAYGPNGEFLGYRGSARDITEQLRAQDAQNRMERRDPVTGLLNRPEMHASIANTLRIFRNTKQSCAIMLVDLDRFKQVNEALGHAAGNELLRQAGERLTRIAANAGSVARINADEFLLMFPEIDDRGILGDIGQRVVQMLAQPYSVDGRQANVGASIGIATAPYDGIEAQELIDAAELAMFSAKANGKGRYRFYSSDLKEQARTRGELEADLRGAVDRGELKVFYQPIVDAETLVLTCVEALIRWEHPVRGPVSPAEFIPIAEESGLIRPIGAWALRQVCEDASNWPVEVRAAINVSAVQLHHDDLVKTVADALDATGVDPARIELEITESVFLGDFESALDIFRKLKAKGVRLSLDDFGTGYSSLSYLRIAPFDKIKIDQSFVRGCADAASNQAAIVTAVVRMAEALGMETVAEGIETKDDLELVRQRGATYLQGLIFSGAVPNEVLLGILQSGQLKLEPRGPEKYRADRRTELRRIGLIHDDHRYHVVLRNLSRTGAYVEGLLDVPLGTEVVLDLGGGQLAVATVRRSAEYGQGLEFEMPLISDGSSGLCTRYRVSPYQIEAADRPLAALPDDPYAMMQHSRGGPGKAKAFVEIDLAHRPSAAA
jgi:diguanylate cyclase (GGDEF)-like protein/PAS domain S-box-containing protein